MGCWGLMQGHVLYSCPEPQGGSCLELLGCKKMLLCIWGHLKAAVTSETRSSCLWEQRTPDNYLPLPCLSGWLCFSMELLNRFLPISDLTMIYACGPGTSILLLFLILPRPVLGGGWLWGEAGVGRLHTSRRWGNLLGDCFSVHTVKPVLSVTRKLTWVDSHSLRSMRKLEFNSWVVRMCLLTWNWNQSDAELEYVPYGFIQSLWQRGCWVPQVCENLYKHD